MRLGDLPSGSRVDKLRKLPSGHSVELNRRGLVVHMRGLFSRGLLRCGRECVHELRVGHFR